VFVINHQLGFSIDMSLSQTAAAAAGPAYEQDELKSVKFQIRIVLSTSK
jgi:hypothetical protein